MTQRPGENSFTHALIQSLTELLQERQGKPFTTVQLVDRISQQPSRDKNPSRLWHRLKRDDRIIWLGPLSKQLQESSSIVKEIEPSRAFLTVRLALSSNEKLPKEKIKLLAKKMTQAHKESGLPVRRMDLVNYSRSVRHPALLQRTGRGIVAAIRFQNLSKTRKLSPDEPPQNEDSPLTPNSGVDGFETPTEDYIPAGSSNTRTTLNIPSSREYRKRKATPESSAGDARGRPRAKTDVTPKE
jgi:hypothetical protein